MNINLTTDAKVQFQVTDQDIVMLDDATSELDVDITYFILEIINNALLEPHEFSAPSNGGSKRVQKQSYRADFI